MRLGFVGWRGLVGSVLRERMQAEADLSGLDVTYFSTSQAGEVGPDGSVLADAHDTAKLAACDVLISCQGGDYTKQVHPALRAAGWDGYWIDSASTLRMEPDAIIVLDPINRAAIDTALQHGRTRDLIGGNCTTSLMMLALAGLLQRGLIEWVSTMTYQAVSGAGARAMIELLTQMHAVDAAVGTLDQPILTADAKLSKAMRAADLQRDVFGAPLVGSLLPWIDRAMADGQTREEWKTYAETNKILGADPPLPVDGVCVRVPTMRCHSQAIQLKLTRAIDAAEATALLSDAHAWVDLVPNDKDATLRDLTPAAVAGGLRIAVGRVRNTRLGGDYLSLFTVGDQLLWGAAEPVRRALRIVLAHEGVRDFPSDPAVISASV